MIQILEDAGTPPEIPRRARFAADLWMRLETWLDVHADDGFGSIRAAWRKSCLTLGQEVAVQTGEEQIVGRAEDIDETGALVIITGEGARRRILAGDVEQVRRPPRSD